MKAILRLFAATVLLTAVSACGGANETNGVDLDNWLGYRVSHSTANDGRLYVDLIAPGGDCATDPALNSASADFINGYADVRLENIEHGEYDACVLLDQDGDGAPSSGDYYFGNMYLYFETSSYIDMDDASFGEPLP